jgi:uncharacterized membrane protein
MMHAMQFAHPSFLLLWPLLAAWVWLGLRRSLAGWSPRQRAVCRAVRLLLFALLCAGLAGPRLLLPARSVAVVFAVDDSASISAAAREEAHRFVARGLAARRGNDAAGLIGFARSAEVWQPVVALSQPPAAWPQLHDRAASDLGGSLDFATAILPPTGSRRIVLLSDGNDTEGAASDAARRAAQAGIELWTVPLHNAQAPEVLVEKVEVPRRLQTGEPFDLSARIRSNVATTAKVKLYQNQFLIEQRDLTLAPGVTDFRVPNLRPEGTFVSYEVEVVPAQDTSVENNRATATASLRGEPRVLIVDNDARQIEPLATALRREKITVETRGPAGLPATLEDLQQYDLFILSDLSALRISHDRMELYRRWVQELGGGFLMLGGENSYGVGGYYSTPIEQMLPVRMDHEDRQETPTVAMLVVLDRSGSMTAQVQGQTKISLADQGAVFAMNALQPKDFFGVLAVDTKAHAVVPLAQGTGRQTAEQNIMTITAGGGGIYIYTSLAEAFQTLRDVNARIKHVIVFSDAADAEEKFAGEMSDGAAGAGGTALDLAAAMVSARITVSVVGLGTEQDKDTAWLRQLAERGNGRFYLTSDPTNLPQIFSTETMRVAQSSLIEEPFLAVAAGRSPMIAGIDWPQSPLLLGYNTTRPKPTAEVLLATERGEPLFATWRYGLGQAAAFTSDAKSRWASEWLGWPGYGKFWAQVVRGLRRHGEKALFQVTTHEEGDALALEIEAGTAAGGFRNGLAVQVHALGPDGASRTVRAAQAAPGNYRARLPLPQEGTTVISISAPELPEGNYVFGHTRSYPREFLTTETNEPALRELAEIGHGRFAAAPEEVFAAAAEPRREPLDLTSGLLAAFLILLPFDIWLRRRNWSG